MKRTQDVRDYAAGREAEKAEEFRDAGGEIHVHAHYRLIATHVSQTTMEPLHPRR